MALVRSLVPFVLVLAVFSTLLAARAVSAQPVAIERALQWVDRIALDYHKAIRKGEVSFSTNYQRLLEMQQHLQTQLSEVADLPPQTTELATQLAQGIQQRVDRAEILRLRNELRTRLVQHYPLSLAALNHLDLDLAQSQYESQCAVCHGLQGRGDGPSASYDPRPTDFTDRFRASQQSLHGLFLAIHLGVPNSEMKAFRALPEANQWSLAFYVASLQSKGDDGDHSAAQALTFNLPAELILSENEAQISQWLGDQGGAGLKWLRHSPHLLQVALTDNDLVGVRYWASQSLTALQNNDLPQLRAWLEVPPRRQAANQPPQQNESQQEAYGEVLDELHAALVAADLEKATTQHRLLMRSLDETQHHRHDGNDRDLPLSPTYLWAFAGAVLLLVLMAWYYLRKRVV